MSGLCFLDTETTGLDVYTHDLVEVSYALDDGEIVTWTLPHTLHGADPAALRINGYFDRHLYMSNADQMTETRIAKALAGRTLVGSNPAFDAAFLRRRLGVATWHHRLIDVAQGAMWVYGWDKPKGLADVVSQLRADGHDIPDPDHTAAGDVAVTRAVYRALSAA